MVRKTLELLYRCRHRHWALEVTLHLGDWALGHKAFTSLVACRGGVKRGALVLEYTPASCGACLVALVVRAALHVTSFDFFLSGILPGR